MRSGLFSKITVATDGQEALTVLESAGHSASAPELVVSDLRMPRVNGIELVKALKVNPRTFHLPIAILTSSERPEARAAALDAGACGFFLKGAQHELGAIFRTIIARMSRDFEAERQSARRVS